ncbi:helix-turn-helix domain-containing protein [Nocardia terpenica]|uniref:Helix-turn-helix domain-containing protein n=1 Tax=Nocardia terpenica TaxID=455432 RepID=A0A6G9Z947_9NOCA|nr:helix-turn-helix domain-containing protein [Nocardia terpenica]QIS22115.1 helix-turn-helix domain-containing protein [Nocardia terpenica]
MVATDIALMTGSADAIEADSGAPELGDGTALPADSLVLQIRDYINRHLADRNLAPARIARAHGISVRCLYRLCADADLSLHQWIIVQRPCHVRRDLVNPRRRSIAAVAQRYGFRDASHLPTVSRHVRHDTTRMAGHRRRPRPGARRQLRTCAYVI